MNERQQQYHIEMMRMVEQFPDYDPVPRWMKRKIVGLAHQGVDAWQVAMMMNVSFRTISRTWPDVKRRIS